MCLADLSPCGFRPTSEYVQDRKAPLAPGPRGHWLLGNLKEQRSDPLKLFLGSIRDYGDVVRFRIGPLWIHLIGGADACKHVLVDEGRSYEKGKLQDPLKLVVGQGLLTSEGDHWKRQRRLSQPAFHRERLVGLSFQMVKAIEDMAERWEGRVGEVLDVYEEMLRLTLDIVTRTLFSSDVAQRAPAIKVAMDVASEQMNRRLLTPLPLWMPIPGDRGLRAALRELNRVVYGMIDERLSGKVEADDLLSMLMEAVDAETGERMTRLQLRDEVMTIFLAGHETTANALAWFWRLSAGRAEIARQLEREARAVLGGRAAGMEDLHRFPLIRQAIEEAMRLYPPAYVLPRFAIQEDEIDGYRIPKGSPVIVCIYALHRNPRLWTDPERFDPSRFTPQQSAARPKYAYLPFGAGQRMCIGYQFAMMEAIFTAATLAQRFAFEEVPGIIYEPQAHVTLRAHNLRMRLTLAPATAAEPPQDVSGPTAPSAPPAL